MRPWYLVGAVVLVLLLVGVASPIFAAHVHQSSWGSAAYYPGDPAAFYMTLFNDYPGTISVKEILMHWDWQGDGGSYYASAGGQTLIPIQTEDYIINFTIPTNVSVGQHLWTIYYLDLNNKKNFVGEGALKVHDPNERTFLSLQAGVRSDLASFVGTVFENPNASSLLASANGAFASSASFADSGDFIGAILILKNASALMAGAVTAENAYQAAKKVYLWDLSSTTVALDRAKSSSYQRQNATLYLGQAMALYEQATFLASAGKYANADGVLRTADSLIDRANAAEQEYSGQSASITSATKTTTPGGSTEQSSTAAPTVTSTTTTVLDSLFHATFAPPSVESVFPETWALGGLASIVLVGSLLVVVLAPRKRK